MSEHQGELPQVTEPPPKTITRIEVKPAQDIIDDWIWGERDYGWVEDLETDPSYIEENRKDIEASENRIGGVLEYEPFDVRAELRSLRHPTDDSQRNSEFREKRMSEIRDNLSHQTLGLATEIRDLYAFIHESPDASVEDLMEHVRLAAPEYKFTRMQLHHFRNGIDQYIEKHTAVEKYRKKYPEDTDLYEICFGSRPTGKVSVATGPMAIHFGCVNKDDYVMAFNAFKTDGDVSKLETKDVKQALSSSGVAFSRVKEPELDGVVTAQRAEIAYDYREQTKKESDLVKKELELSMRLMRGDITIAIDEKQWKIKIVEYNESGAPVRYQFWDSDNPDDKPVSDYRIHHDPLTYSSYFLEDVKYPLAEKKTVDREYLAADNHQFGHITISGGIIRVINDSEAKMIVSYTRKSFQRVDLDEVEFDEDTLIHEEQHLFNKLYAPLEHLDQLNHVMQSAVDASDDPEKIKQTLYRELTRYYRRLIGIDARARDEILACYSEGDVPDEIADILLRSDLYDYKMHLKERIALLPDEIAEAVKQEMSSVLYDLTDDGVNLVDAQPLELDPDGVLPHIDEVFGEEYSRDVKSWVNCVSELEKKGYSRYEVLAFLYQEPVNAWKHFIKRLPQKAA